MADDFVAEEMPTWHSRPVADGDWPVPPDDAWPAHPDAGADAWPAPPPPPDAPVTSREETPSVPQATATDQMPPVAPSTATAPSWSVRSPERENGPSLAADPSQAAFAPQPQVRMPWEPAPRTSSPMRYVLGALVLLGLCGVAALFVTGTVNNGPSIEQPSSVGALQAVDSPALTQALQQLQQVEQSAGATQVVTGVYGAGAQPQLLLLVVQSPQINGSAADGLQNFMSGFSGGLGTSGWSLDTGNSTTMRVNGTQFDCDPMTSSQLPGHTLSTCVWTDRDVAGVVVDVTGQSLADTLNEAVQAKAAAEH